VKRIVMMDTFVTLGPAVPEASKEELKG